MRAWARLLLVFLWGDIGVFLSGLLPGCVNWHDGRGWHRPATGIEAELAKNFSSGQGYAECRGIYPGISVYSARWTEFADASLPAHVDCLGDVAGAIQEAREAASLTEAEIQGLDILLMPEGEFRCGKDFHRASWCVSADGVTVLASWWTVHQALAEAFKHLAAARVLGREM